MKNKARFFDTLVVVLSEVTLWPMSLYSLFTDSIYRRDWWRLLNLWKLKKGDNHEDTR